MKINFNEMPSGYTLCVINDCPMAAHCLRQLAMQAIVKKDKILTIVNPHQVRLHCCCSWGKNCLNWKPLVSLGSYL